MKSEIHLSIVWSNAREFDQLILGEIGSNFKIIKVYEVTWNNLNFVENLKRFYSHSQVELSQRALHKLMSSKAKHCGSDPFLLIIFEDLKPVHHNRLTSNGPRRVNANVFDIKKKLRHKTGGGHLIHGTDSTSETNKDLTLLLGLNLTDFKLRYNFVWDECIEKINRDVLGLNGFESIKQLFYLLNSTIDYVVLRNFEEMPDKVTLNEHSDVDILVRNKNLFVYSTGAKPVFKQKYRVHYKIEINKILVPFDVRFLGDRYFDENWQNKVLNTRYLHKNIFYRPNEEEYFFTLLYHALIHKPQLSKEYELRLSKMALDINKKLPGLKLLEEYLLRNKYNFCEPSDYSVYFNHNTVSYSFLRQMHCVYLPKIRLILSNLLRWIG